MSEETISQVDEKFCLDDAKPTESIEEPSVETQGVGIPLPAALSNMINHVNPRRYSTGTLDKSGPGKAQVSTRYRGNQSSSTHDLCKHGKRREEDLVIKPWKLVKKKNVEGGDLVKGETLGVMRKSLGNVSNPEKSLQVAKSEIVKSSVSPSSEEVKEPRVTRSDPRPIRQTTSSSKSKTGLPEKKEIGSANLVANSKPESKIRPKRIGLRVNPPPPPTVKQVGFKKGKVLEPKPADSTPTLLKFKKRVVQEPKLRSDVNKKKKNLKDKREGLGKMNGEVKREKVVLRHRKVEAKKKLQTLFNNVIEETVNKLEEARKSKVKALVGAFETVISLQDNDKTSQKKKVQSKSTSSQVVEG